MNECSWGKYDQFKSDNTPKIAKFLEQNDLPTLFYLIRLAAALVVERTPRRKNSERKKEL
jgi:hypothetical protein